MSKVKHENYTELVHAGEGVKIDKGIISAEGGSGSGAFIVNIKDITNESFRGAIPVFALDKNYSEIVKAINDGMTPFVYFYNNGESRYQLITIVEVIESSYWVHVGDDAFGSSDPNGILRSDYEE